MAIRKRKRQTAIPSSRIELTGDAHVDAMAREALTKKRGAQLKALAGLLLLSMVVATFGSLYTLVKFGSENHEGVIRLVDCTTPGGACYKQLRSPENNRSVDYIKEITILAASCAKVDGNITADQIRKCVESELDRSSHV